MEELDRLLKNLDDLTQEAIKKIKENPGKATLGAILAIFLTYKALEDTEGDYNEDVDIYIWDVEHGDCILIKGPEENYVIDLSKHGNGFSPSKHMSKYINEVDALIISHPDKDHIEDILNFYEEFDPSIFARPKSATGYLKHKKENVYPDDEEYQEITDKYLEVTEERYTETPDIKLSNSRRNQGLKVKHHSLSVNEVSPPKPLGKYDEDEDPNINNLSLLTIVEYEGFKLVTCGDLQEEALEAFLEKESVRGDLKGTDVLIAPHHGRKSSYCSELFDVIAPDLVIVSDKSNIDPSKTATDRYSDKAGGKWVESRNGKNESRERYCVSTRDVGYINLKIQPRGNYKAYTE